MRPPGRLELLASDASELGRKMRVAPISCGSTRNGEGGKGGGAVAEGHGSDRDGFDEFDDDIIGLQLVKEFAGKGR